MIGPGVTEGVNLIGLEVVNDLRVDYLVEKAGPFFHDWIHGVDL